MSEATHRKPDTKDGVFFDDPELPEGWTRKCVQRSTGQSAGKWDVYIYNPMGRKFRSQNEIRRYLEEIGSELCPDLFCFNPYAQAGTPSGRRRVTGPATKPASASSSANKPASEAVKAARAKSLGSGSSSGDSVSSGTTTKLKLKFDFAKRVGRPASTGKPGRPPGKPGRPPGKPGRPPGKPGRPPSTGKPGRPPSTGKPGRPPSTGKPGRPPSTGKPGRPPSSGKPGRPPSSGKPGRPPSTGKPGRPPGRPGRPAGSGASLASPPLRPTAPRVALPATPLIAVPSVVATTTTGTATQAKGSAAPKKRQWVPPESPYGLVQERYYQDPWKLLIGTIFLSKPIDASPEDVWGDPPPVLECRRARPLLEKFFERWPTAKAVRDASAREIQELIEPLQLGEHVAQLIIRFSDEYLTKKWKSPTELYGIGRYGSDAYRIFCLGQWKQVRPLDHMLSLYHNWLWTNYKALRLD